MTKKASKAQKQQAYIPGMCNINTAEVAYRRKAMYMALFVTIVLLMVLVFFQVNVFLRSLALALPLYITAICYLQVKNSFCVSYAASGQQNATDGQDTAETITEKSALAADKKKAREMYLQALVATAIPLLLLLLIPAN